MCCYICTYNPIRYKSLLNIMVVPTCYITSGYFMIERKNLLCNSGSVEIYRRLPFFFILQPSLFIVKVQHLTSSSMSLRT